MRSEACAPSKGDATCIKFLVDLIFLQMPFSTFSGMLKRGPRPTNREGQWGVEKWQYEADTLPAFLVGGAYVLNYRLYYNVSNKHSARHDKTRYPSSSEGWTMGH